MFVQHYTSCSGCRCAGACTFMFCHGVCVCEFVCVFVCAAMHELQLLQVCSRVYLILTTLKMPFASF